MVFLVSIFLLCFSAVAPLSAAFRLSADSANYEYTPSNIGIVGLRYLHQRGSLSTVVEVYPGTPAAEAGIREGDRIVKVEGVDIKPFDADGVYQAMAGLPGQPVKLEMMRCDPRCQNFIINLTRIDMNAVASENVFRVYKYGL
jgi:C-terminal processing protease CtpA/Prc